MKAKTSRHYRQEAFLKQLGEHCRKLRVQQGYSIDRMSKEGEALSPSVIQRLETGAGAVTIMTLLRYAQVLNKDIRDLFSFIEGSAVVKKSLLVLPEDHPRVAKEAFKKLLPLYSLKAAAGHFGTGADVNIEGWVDVSGASLKLNPRMFVAQAVGRSMEPKIHNGDYLLFQAHPVGTRQNKIVLAQYRGPADPETGGTYTVKRYRSVKQAKNEDSWQHQSIHLESLNPAFKTLLLNPSQASEFQIVAELLKVF